MDIAINISNRELNPAVVNFFQHENQTVTLNFTLDSYMYGEVDLRNYKAYGVTSQNGMVDMTELEATYDSSDDKLTLKWLVQEYSLRQEGAITYQIVFKENADDGENTAVFYSYKGIMINRGSVDGDNHITANYPTILKQWLDKIDELAGTLEAGIIYIPYGETIPTSERLSGRVYFQFTDAYNTEGRFEDHEGNELNLSAYLPLTGGEISGAVTFSNSSGVSVKKKTNDGTLVLSGGRDSASSTLQLNGNESGNNAGWSLAANNGTTRVQLLGYSNGGLVWDDKNIVRTVNNTNANTSGNVTVDVGVTTVNGKKGALNPADTGCLPLTGGTLTGGVNLSGKALNAGAIELNPGSDYENGGVVDFHYAGSTDNYTSRIIEDGQGKLGIVASNGVTVNNKHVVRSVNGTVADNAGNVEITSVQSATSATKATQDGNGKVIANTYLPLAGGILTGTLKSSAAPALQSLNTDSQLILLGGNSTNAGGGAKLTLNGGEHTDAGEFILQAGKPGDSTAVYSQLIGKPDGTLTWNGNKVISEANKETIVGWGMPDYSAGISIANNTDYKVPTDGIVYFSGVNSTGARSTVKLNGVVFMVGFYSTTSYTGFSGSVLVNKNDIINVNFSQSKGTLEFYPFKGV